MAQICREIQERIETTRNEAHQECRNVSRTITETICSWLPWPFSELCRLVTRIITEVVCGIVWVVVTIVSWVTRVICETIYVVVWLVNLIINFAEWLIDRIINLPQWLGCLLGIKGFSKKFRICPIIIADENGNPTVDPAFVQNQINAAIEVYRQCSIDVIAQPITIIRGKAHLATASDCGAAGFFDFERIEYDALTCCENGFSLKCSRFPSGFILPRAILKAVFVREIEGTAVGCYIPFEGFVLVDGQTPSVNTLAHEMGHAGDLWGHSDDPTNLMAPGTIRTGTSLTNFQCCTVRSSRWVTLL